MQRPERQEGKGFTPEALGWMERRTRAFQRATTRWPGKQTTYGAGKEPLWSEDDREAQEAAQRVRDARRDG